MFGHSLTDKCLETGATLKGTVPENEVNAEAKLNSEMQEEAIPEGQVT